MIKLQISSKWNHDTKSLIIPITSSKNPFKNIEPLNHYNSTTLKKTFKGEKGELQILPTEKQTIYLL
ncbi:MAG: hypothetical protein AAFO82_22600, partial [Bacteroidota bacterium]